MTKATDTSMLGAGSMRVAVGIAIGGAFMAWAGPYGEVHFGVPVWGTWAAMALGSLVGGLGTD